MLGQPLWDWDPTPFGKSWINHKDQSELNVLPEWVWKVSISVSVLHLFLKQVCIPVGCVPAAHLLYAAVFFPRGCLPVPGDVCLVWGEGVLLGQGGFSLVLGGFSLPGGGGSAWSGGSPWSRGGSLCRGVCLVLGGSAWSWGDLPGPRGGSLETPL